MDISWINCVIISSIITAHRHMLLSKMAGYVARNIENCICIFSRKEMNMWFIRPSYIWECNVEGGAKETGLGDVGG
jgi:hypothetical protein